MIIAPQYDMTRLEDKTSMLVGALLGRGEDGDVQKLLTVEAGQCAWRISQTLGPESQSVAKKGIQKDVGGFFTDKPAWSNLDESQQHSSEAGFEWLAAGPGFLTGIAKSDNQLGATASDVVSTYYNMRSAGMTRAGKRYIELGKRGHQQVQKLNRIRVSTGSIKGAIAAISERVGQSKAAFARAAAELIPFKRIPAWVSAKIPMVSQNGKSIFEDRIRGERPSVDFGSRCKGVESNPAMRSKIEAGVSYSERVLDSKMRKILQGYSYNWNTGQVFKAQEQNQEP